MSDDRKDLWQALLSTGHELATEADYEHGYRREIRSDLRRYVTFAIGNETYGLPIDVIVEIAKPFGTTLVPRTPEFLIGIGNVRGMVMPVIDLPTRLRLGRAEMSSDARVLIVRHEQENYALIVDRVQEVLPLAPEDLEETPGGIGSSRAEFIMAIGRDKGRLIIILDLENVLDIRPLIEARVRAGQGGRKADAGGRHG